MAALVLGYNMRGVLTLDWQRMYKPEEFTSLGDLWDFLSELQTGISPLWASLEILCRLLIGTTGPIAKLAWPLALGLSYVLALRTFAHSVRQLYVTASLALFLMLVTRLLHPGNPQLYDVYMPALFLGFLAALRRYKLAEGSGKKAWRIALLAGFLLAALELTRTFIFVLMPILVPCALLAFGTRNWKVWLAFLLPVVLLSGGWHLKQIVKHDQVQWSNHSGFNLYKSWSEFVGPVEYQEEPPRYQGGFTNLNTDTHTANNKDITRKIMAGIAAQPGKAISHAGKRLLAFYRPKTNLYLSTLPKAVEWIYRPVVWALGLMLAGLFGRLLFLVLRAPLKKSSWQLLGESGNILLVFGALTSLLFAIGESGEEARFMISILPILACLPVLLPFFWRKPDSLK